MSELPSLEGRLLGGRYRIGRVLGAGGMGAVYAAEQEDLERRVAVKVLTAKELAPEDLTRFKQEALAVAKLGHPNIVQVTDFQAWPDEPALLVMELLEGESLRALLDREVRLPPARAAFIITQVLAALASAHASGIIHRDIKPANIFLSRTPAMSDLVKVLDFGIAKAPTLGIGFLTAPGMVLGTPPYMSPEQAHGESSDHRADLYAVGICLFEMLAGRRPYRAATLGELLESLGRGVPTLRSVRADVDPRLAEIVDRALQRDPQKRARNALDMLGQLASFVKGGDPVAQAAAATVSSRSLGLAVATAHSAVASKDVPTESSRMAPPSAGLPAPTVQSRPRATAAMQAASPPHVAQAPPPPAHVARAAAPPAFAPLGAEASLTPPVIAGRPSFTHPVTAAAPPSWGGLEGRAHAQAILGSATQSLAWSVVGVAIFWLDMMVGRPRGLYLLLFPLTLLGVGMGVRAWVLSRRHGASMPVRGVFGVLFGAVSVLGSVLLVGYSYHSLNRDQEAVDERVRLIDRQIGPLLEAPKLEPSVACALAEAHVLRAGYKEDGGMWLSDFECAGSLDAEPSRARLLDFRFTARSKKRAVSVCFERTDRWRVREIGETACY